MNLDTELFFHYSDLYTMQPSVHYDNHL